MVTQDTTIWERQRNIPTQPMHINIIICTCCDKTEDQIAQNKWKRIPLVRRGEICVQNQPGHQNGRGPAKETPTANLQRNGVCYIFSEGSGATICTPPIHSIYQCAVRKWTAKNVDSKRGRGGPGRFLFSKKWSERARPPAFSFHHAASEPRQLPRPFHRLLPPLVLIRNVRWLQTCRLQHVSVPVTTTDIIFCAAEYNKLSSRESICDRRLEFCCVVWFILFSSYRSINDVLGDPIFSYQ